MALLNDTMEVGECLANFVVGGDVLLQDFIVEILGRQVVLQLGHNTFQHITECIFASFHARLLYRIIRLLQHLLKMIKNRMSNIVNSIAILKADVQVLAHNFIDQA